MILNDLKIDDRNFKITRPVVVMGAGGVFQKIRPALDKLGAEKLLIIDPAYQGPGKIERLEEAPDGSPALILTPNIFHLEQALNCLELERPFYLEKPMVVSVKECSVLAESLAERPGAKAYFGDYYFFQSWPLVSFLKRRPESPWLDKCPSWPEFGPISRIEGVLHEGGEDPSGTIDARQWLSQSALGGGMLLDLMIHFTNILEVLDYRIAEIEDCVLYKFVGLEKGRFELLDSPERGEDMAAVKGTLTDGTPVNLSVAKYAAAHELWLKFEDESGWRATLFFDPLNSLEIEDPKTGTKLQVTLTVDPYYLTMLEAMHFFQEQGEAKTKYFEQQAASISLIERMKNCYWAGAGK